VNAVPNEHEFNKLFGLDTSEGRLIPAAGEASEETHPDMGRFPSAGQIKGKRSE